MVVGGGPGRRAGGGGGHQKKAVWEQRKVPVPPKAFFTTFQSDLAGDGVVAGGGVGGVGQGGGREGRRGGDQRAVWELVTGGEAWGGWAREAGGGGQRGKAPEQSALSSLKNLTTGPIWLVRGMGGWAREAGGGGGETRHQRVPVSDLTTGMRRLYKMWRP